jgi:serine/threonine-protein kinase
MAPEMVHEGAAAVGVEADIYALGVIAYQVLTGTRPVDDTASAMTSAPTAPERDLGPVPPSRLAPDVPPALDAVILQALSHQPSMRPASATALAAALRQACPAVAAAR